MTPWFPPHRSGIAIYVSNLCAHLTRLGRDVSILTVKKLTQKPFPQGYDYAKTYSVNCIYLPGWPYPTLSSVSVPVDAGLKIYSIIKNGGFDVVHAHGIHYPICWLALYHARRLGIHSVLSLHGTFALNPSVLSGESRTEKWLYRHFFSRILSQADTVIGPAKTVTNLAEKYCKRNSPSFCTIGYGVNTGRFVKNLDRKEEYRKKYNISEEALVFLFCGRFEKVKGILEFARAIKRIVIESDRKIEAVMIGAGTLHEQVSSVINDVPGIQMFDWQPEDIIHEFYIASDIFVIPSRFEGVPLTILEAMNAGLHILYTPVGGIPEVLDGYPSKTLIGEISELAIYRALLSLNSTGLAKQEKNDRVAYGALSDWRKISDKINKVYEDLISNSASN